MPKFPKFIYKNKYFLKIFLRFHGYLKEAFVCVLFFQLAAFNDLTSALG